jgi:hypothetical protein
MDPYLERFWGDVHTTLITLAKFRLQGELPHTLRARAQERVVVEDPDPLTPSRRFIEPTHRYLEIIDVATGGRVVTVIEFLSPTNKRAGDGRDKYRQKRLECVHGRVNFVEIDLTREGPRALLAEPHQVPPSHQTTYLGCVFRAARPDDRALYGMPLWKPLPPIKVPLRPVDDDVLLPLQPLIDEVYERGQYEIDYTQPCRPPLEPADVAELERRLRVTQ